MVNASVLDPAERIRLSKQCRLLFDRLRHGPITNVAAITELSLYNLTARVSELRQLGHDIRATRIKGGLWLYELIPPPAPGQLDLGHVR